MTGYKYDVFLSYRRTSSGTVWVNEFFKPLFEDELSQSLGRDTKVFVDVNDIPNGVEWQEYLNKEALARSRCLVPVFCGLYFQSEWCSSEFAVFLGRLNHLKEKEHTGRTALRVIHPILARDGDHLPKEVKKMNFMDMSEHFTNCSAFRNSLGYRDFENIVRKFAKEVGSNIRDDEQFPQWDPAWETEEWLNHCLNSSFFDSKSNNIYQCPQMS